MTASAFNPASMGRDAAKALICALGLGILSTFGDWLWTHYLEDGAIVPGIVHGAVILLAMAAVLAWASGSARAWRILLPSLPILGVVLAASFYPIAMTTGYLPALLITWIAMWLGTSWLNNRARGMTESASRTLLRGTNAALFSGLAFWLIAGIWTQPSPDGPNYWVHFVSWTFAFLPGFLSLLLLQPPVETASKPLVGQGVS